MDDEPERTKRWEGGYERTWEILKEDESGSLKATIEDILFKAKRKRLYEHHGQVRLGMMRHLYVVVDGSRTMEDQDLKPNRLTCTLKLLEYFVEEYFDQNPISQIGLIVTKSKRAEKMTELSGNSKKHVTALKKAVDMNCSGEPSLYNSLNLAMQTLKHMPGHTSREVLVVFSSLTTCDPANIYDLIKCLKAVKIRVSVIGLSAEVRVCTVLARETGGTYHVILDESHYKELLMHHVSPPPASSSSECSLIRMGFPQHTIASLSDQDAKPSFSMAQLENNSEPGLTLGGYFCPQCRAKYCELPVECKICGLTLVSAPHLARSYHHLFPLDAFQEVALEEYQGERFTYVKCVRMHFVWNAICLFMILCTAVLAVFTSILLPYLYDVISFWKLSYLCHSFINLFCLFSHSFHSKQEDLHNYRRMNTGLGANFNFYLMY
ncbi:general transcription factor IIH subunit 2 isoform X1 [Pelecanus crispus]|uniref:general transcription factor IIH subunit 2 isoform X1 n=1 Tax=Pelecanus crispus TaxID=36300 RepID=UPI003F5D2387